MKVKKTFYFSRADREKIAKEIGSEERVATPDEVSRWIDYLVESAMGIPETKGGKE